MRLTLPPVWRRRIATAFTIFHLAAVAAFVLPGDMSPLRSVARRAVFDPYLRFTGFWQFWDFFAPQPQTANFEVELQAEYEDGSVAKWVPPGPEGRSIFERYRLERMRKWRENLRQDDWSVLRPDAARLALRHFLESNPEVPKRIRFVRRWRVIPPPAPGDFQPRAPEPLDHEYVFYEWPEPP